jgi:predicted nucleic acid-binding protein
MIVPDVNVLIYAFRRDVSQHRVCRPWLAPVISNDARFGLSPMVLNAVVQITTNSRAFRTPSAIDEAFGFCEDLLGQPTARLSSRARGIGTSSEASASRPISGDHASPMPGSRRSP